jgi:hypothetical protein
VHARPHGFDQFLNFAAAYFRDAHGPGALPQNGISGLNDFKFHGSHNFQSCANGIHAAMDFIPAGEDMREARRDKMKIAKFEK